MLSKKSSIAHAILLCVLLSTSPVFFLSCGEKKNTHSKNIATYGPIDDSSNPAQPSLLVENCEPGEYITCDLKYQYSSLEGRVYHTISEGLTCPSDRVLTFVFDLGDCSSQGWSGDASCTGTKSTLRATQPVQLKALCRLS